MEIYLYILKSLSLTHINNPQLMAERKQGRNLGCVLLGKRETEKKIQKSNFLSPVTTVTERYCIHDFTSIIQYGDVALTRRRGAYSFYIRSLLARAASVWRLADEAS